MHSSAGQGRYLEAPCLALNPDHSMAGRRCPDSGRPGPRAPLATLLIHPMNIRRVPAVCLDAYTAERQNGAGLTAQLPHL